MKRLRLAVVGVGVMGRYHANIYAVLPHVDLVAVVDPSASRRQEACETFGCRAYATLDDLIEREDVDAASVAAPTSLHYAITNTLLHHGIHVLVEKPVATNVSDARELAALSRDRGLVLQVGHITRFFQAVQLLSERIDDPYFVEARRLVPNTRIKDVGVILDLMIHDIDIVLGLVASRIVDISVAGQILNGSAHEDVAAAQIRFENGCIARFLASRAAPDAERTLAVSEIDQTIRLDFAKEPYTEVAIYRPVAGPRGTSHVQMDRHVVHEENPLRKELEHFLARIRHTADPIGTLEDDLRSLELATNMLARMQRHTRGVLV